LATEICDGLALCRSTRLEFALGRITEDAGENSARRSNSIGTTGWSGAPVTVRLAIVVVLVLELTIRGALAGRCARVAVRVTLGARP